MKEKRLYRNGTTGYVGGVCAGLQDHTGLDANLWRLASVFIPGGIVVYVILWIITPEL